MSDDDQINFKLIIVNCTGKCNGIRPKFLSFHPGAHLKTFRRMLLIFFMACSCEHNKDSINSWVVSQISSDP